MGFVVWVHGILIELKAGKGGGDIWPPVYQSAKKIRVTPSVSARNVLQAGENEGKVGASRRYHTVTDDDRLLPFRNVAAAQSCQGRTESAIFRAGTILAAFFYVSGKPSSDRHFFPPLFQNIFSEGGER
ncbi:MAG: hypothetical protein LBH14_03480 [Desulfobulbaceae bacterium]|jgi:hypothetical protein|nr:hypothetical protein [Desulfobulbaceae bacterium]